VIVRRLPSPLLAAALALAAAAPPSALSASPPGAPAASPSPAPAPATAAPAPAAPRPAEAGPDGRVALLEAMSAEIARSMERLRLPGYEAPYFASYQLREIRAASVGGRHGAVIEDRARLDRRLSADVRVGGYDLDSSGGDDAHPFVVGDGPGWSAPREAPLDDDPVALRNALWLLTDERYKEALSAWFKKRGKGVYRAEGEEARAPSFSREPRQRHVDPPLPFAFDRERWRREVREVTGRLRAEPALLDATMKVEGEKLVRWFASSEGSRIVTESAIYAVHVSASARAADGQLLENGRDWYGRSEAELPAPEEIRAEAQRMAAELVALREAPSLDPYTGPAILAPEAAGVLFHEAVGHRLEGDRQDDDREGRTFKGQLGKPVLPAFLSVVDDPTLRTAAGTPLNGWYRFDDQGVPAQRAVLVRDGTLEGFILSRKPVKPFSRSNGHARSQGGPAPVARMANLVVTASRSVPMAELKRMLLAEAKRQGKPYGLLVRDAAGGNTNTAGFGYQAFKGTPRLVYRVDVETGREDLVRGVEIVGTPLAAVNRVVAAGDDVRVFNGYCGAESGYVPVSTVAPAVLVAEIELQRSTRPGERSPVLPAPSTEGSGR
jgi:TldD protein